MIIFEKDFEEEACVAFGTAWEAQEEAWEKAWDEWAAREASAQEYYDSLSEEEFETLLEEGNRLWAIEKA